MIYLVLFPFYLGLPVANAISPTPLPVSDHWNHVAAGHTLGISTANLGIKLVTKFLTPNCRWAEEKFSLRTFPSVGLGDSNLKSKSKQQNVNFLIRFGLKRDAAWMFKA